MADIVAGVEGKLNPNRLNWFVYSGFVRSNYTLKRSPIQNIKLNTPSCWVSPFALKVSTGVWAVQLSAPGFPVDAPQPPFQAE